MAKEKKQLHDLEASEISLVAKGAIKRKFLVTKSADDDEDDEEVEKMKKTAEEVQKAFAAKVKGMMANGNQSVMEKVDSHIKKYNTDRGAVDAAPETTSESVAQEQGETTDTPLTEEANAAIKAIVRILGGFKDQLDPQLLHEVLEIVGFKLGATPDAEAEANEGGVAPVGAEGEESVDGVDAANESGEPGEPVDGEKEPKEGWSEIDQGDAAKDGENDSPEVKPEHMAAAAKVANDAFKSHLGKLGYQKPPEARMAIKGKVSQPKGGIVPPERSANKQQPVVGAKGEAVTKAVESTVDLSQVDPKVREQVELVFKSNAELVKKAADLEAKIMERDAADRNRELVQKAAAWQNLGLPQETIVAQLKDADSVGKESFERICKSFDALNEQASKGGLFSELGSSMQTPAGGSPDQMWDRIEKAAEGVVKKSAGMSREKAIELFLMTADGSKMYAEYKNAKGGI